MLAWRSFMGFQSCSRKMTVSAEVRLRPRPPTWVVSSSTSMVGSLLKRCTKLKRFLASTLQCRCQIVGQVLRIHQDIPGTCKPCNASVSWTCAEYIQDPKSIQCSRLLDASRATSAGPQLPWRTEVRKGFKAELKCALHHFALQV